MTQAHDLGGLLASPREGTNRERRLATGSEVGEARAAQGFAAITGASPARAAEDLVRAAGPGGSLSWHGASVDSHFQPVLAVRTHSCHGYEAFLRAADTRGVRVPASELYERAGEGGHALLDWSFRALHLRNYARFDTEDRVLFLHVHPRAAIHDAAWAREFAALVRYYGLAPRRVCIEILSDDCDEGLLKHALDVYRGLGVAVALQGFGTGRSNLDRVRGLRPDLVKVDFAQFPGAGRAGSHAGRELASVLAQLHELRAQVVVTGIEEAAQARAAVEVGADFVQGRFFAESRAGLCDEASALDRLRVALGTPAERNLQRAAR